MATKKNAKKVEKKEEGFKEFKGNFNGLDLKGRIYPAKENKGIKRSFMYLDCNYGFTIQCHFVETKNNYFIAFPQYQKKDESYVSYVYIEKDSIWAGALEDLAETLYTMQGGEDD